MTKDIRGAVIGYGGAFNMGKEHADYMRSHGIAFTAVCDLNEERRREAERDFPGIRTFAEVEELLAQPDLDLVTIITPHSAHAPLAKQILQSGKHCIIEKPMCLLDEEARELMRLAEERGLLLSVYHNRRWDGWYTAFRRLADEGELGEVYHAEMFHGGFSVPKLWWRSFKDVSGGAMYDMGAHYLDWLLGFMKGGIQSVRGVAHKRLFHEVTNEDQVDSFLHFDNGATAHIQISSIACHKKPQLRVLGTKGAFVRNGNELTLYRQNNGRVNETRIEPDRVSGGGDVYYRNISDHLRNGAELFVKPEQARRVVAIIEATGRSAEQGQELPVPYEREYARIANAEGRR